MTQKRLLLGLLLVVCNFTIGHAQLTARQVLDKCAATVSSEQGVQADFLMTSAQYGDTNGTISIKGKKFFASTTVAKIWFDGTTLWTYMTKNDEVNVTTPTAEQLQTLNPYNFINMYKSGFTMTMTKSSTVYTVHLTATDASSKVKELFITVDSQSYAPKEIKMLTGNRWSTFTVSNLKSKSLPETMFRFNPSDYPDAEVIDLR